MSSDPSHVSAPRATAGAALHPLIATVARQLCESLRLSLEGMFSACDDHLFDLASRARSNQEQNRLFEGLRQIRQRKPAVLDFIDARLSASFDALGRRETAAPVVAIDATAHYAENLRLVAEEQIEKDVMLADMAARARGEWQQELAQLRERLQRLARRTLDDDENPVDPDRLTRAFAAAADGIDIDLDLLKLIYRQFDRHVLGDLEDMLLKANQTLIDAGILPELPPLWRRAPRQREAPAKPAAAATAAQPPATTAPATSSEHAPFGIPDAEPQMRELAHLLQRMRAEGLRLPMFPASSPDASLPPIPREELVSLLSDTQQQRHGEGEGTPDPLDIREAIAAIIAARGTLRLGQADEDTINVVAMFFDLMLDDRTLPIEIQALVSRLQIPILKVALKDRSFFSERKHPARMLLNEIARTSIGWESGNQDVQDALFRHLSGLVDEVLRAEPDNAGVFTHCLEELSRFNDRSERRAAKVEKRTSERATAEARTAMARDMVRHVLHEHLEGRQLPPDISEFLISDWQPVMQRVYLRHGKDSAEWLEVVQTVADLVWSAQAHSDAKSLARMERLVPELHERIARGLEQVQSHGDEAVARAEVVRTIHARLSGGNHDAITVEALSPRQLEQIVPSDALAGRSWTEMTAVERQQVQFEELTYEYLKRVDDMEIGTWLHYEDLNRGTVRRCKLAARLDEIGSLVFVSRLGMKVMEKPRKAFAYDLQMGHAQVLETAPLFERTIGRIAANLKNLAGEPG